MSAAEPAPTSRSAAGSACAACARRGSATEPRHVRAVPTSAEQRIASAVDAFNSSEHPRTVAGVARSLGVPIVSVRPVAGRPSVVQLVGGVGALLVPLRGRPGR